LGKLLNDEKLYADARETIDKLNKIATGLERGEGTAGKLLKDETTLPEPEQHVG
jgi:phospholipid/cholesterol/gamma-HCH transport system substrate-binding protein